MTQTASPPPPKLRAVETDVEELRAAAGKVPAQSVEAEQALLGSILLDNAAYLDIGAAAPGFVADDFYRTQHRVLFGAITELLDGGKAADIVTLHALLQARQRLDDAGGAAYIAALSDLVPSIANVGHYARIVREKAVRRRLRHSLGEVLALAEDEARPIGEVLNRAEEALASVNAGTGRKLVHERDVMRELLQRLHDTFEKGLPDRAISTGFRTLDAELRIHPTDLVVVGANSGGGKSIFLTQVARAVGASSNARPVLFASLEMSRHEIGERRVMDHGSLLLEDVRKPRTDERAGQVVAAIDDIGRSTRIEYLEDSHDLREILRDAVRMKRRGGLACLVIDYLQILDFPRDWGDTRDQQIGTATRMLKRFAMTHKVPVLVASQLRRPRVDGGRIIPTKDDLRESGNIGNDANAVLILHVPGLVEGTDEYDKGDKRTAKVLIAKQRQGRSMVEIPLVQVFEHARFSEPERPPQEEMDFGGGQRGMG